ncbi:MAG TPA: DUF916 domain-containing protein [Candidatus Dormibacteraeota bacterium]
MAERARFLKATTALAAAALALAVPATAGAANPSASALMRTSHPFAHGYMEYDAAPGQTITDSVTVVNAGPGAATFNIFAADGLTSQATGVVYADQQHPFPDGPSGNGEYGAGTWITLSQSAVQLAAGQGTTVGVAVTVPSTASPGDWVGSVSAENPVASRSGGQFGLSVTTRTTIAVVVHVAGAAKIEGVTVGTPYITVENRTRQVLNIPLQYFGDVLVKPFVDVRVLDSRGRALLQIDRQMDTFVPHTTLVYPIPLDALVLQPGNYSVVIDFGPSGHEQHFQRTLTVAPSQAQVPQPSQRGHAASGINPLLWLLAPVPLVALLLLALLFARHRRTCAHCGRPSNAKRVHVSSVSEVRSCPRCQTALSRRRTLVRLCPDCIAGHRGWSKSATPAPVREAVRR